MIDDGLNAITATRNEQADKMDTGQTEKRAGGLKLFLSLSLFPRLRRGGVVSLFHCFSSLPSLSLSSSYLFSLRGRRGCFFYEMPPNLPPFSLSSRSLPLIHQMQYDAKPSFPSIGFPSANFFFLPLKGINSDLWQPPFSSSNTPLNNSQQHTQHTAYSSTPTACLWHGYRMGAQVIRQIITVIS